MEKKKKTRRNTPRHILIKLTKTKYKKKIKSSKGKATSNIQGNPICLTADLSAETLQATRKWQDTFKIPKGRIYNQYYPARISFKINGEIKSFSDKQKKIQYHQTTFTTNVKGTYIVKK